MGGIFFFKGRKGCPMVFWNSISKGVVVASVVFMMTAAFARLTNYWVGASGNWSDKSNWYLDSAGTIPATRYPGAVTNTIDGVDYRATDDEVLFTSRATGTVTLDVDVSIWRFSVEASSKATSMTFESADAGNPCTLKMTTTTAQSIGDDTSIRDKRTVTFRNIKLRCVSLDFRGGYGIFDTGADVAKADGGQMAMLAWQEDRTIRYLDGCTVKASLDAKRQRATHQIEGGTIIGKIAPESMYCTIRISGGTCNFSSGVALSQNSTIDISGGNVSMSSMKLPATATAIISGGDIKSSAMPNINADATFIFTNGTLTVTADATTTNRRLLGTEDAVFVSTVEPTSSSTAAAGYIKKPSINIFTEDGDSATFSTIYATNGTYSAFHTTNSVTVNANTLNLKRFTIAASKNVTLNAQRLNLGMRLFPTVDKASLAIPNGITFGAFGNWYVYDKKFTLHLGGPVICDTTDCFDGETPHDIGLSKVLALPNVSFEVTGVGTQYLDFAASTNRIARIFVDDGATLIMTNTERHVFVDDLTLGVGSTLRLRAGKGTFDVLSATIDPTANIVMQVPTGLSYTCYPAVVSPDDLTAESIAARMTLDGNGASGWYAGSGAHTAFVTSGGMPTYDESAATSNIWTGAVDSNWSTTGNWTSGIAPRSSNYDNSGNFNVFFGPGNMYVTNDYSKTYINRMYFRTGCGPMVIAGNYIRMKSSTANPSSTGSAIYSVSMSPVIFEAELYHGSNLGVVSVRDSFVALNGKTRCVTFFPSGDIRVGGTLSCTQVLPKPLSGSGRLTTVHVTSGGFMGVTGQTDGIEPAGSRFIVDGGGTLVFSNETGNAVCSVTGMRYPSRINGLLDVHCPYRASHDVYFTGTGTVQFASVRSHESGSATFAVGGGLTLKPKSWTTVTADAPDNYIKIAVTNSAILSAAANWTYGPEAGVATTTTASERALEIADGATLTVKTDGYTVSFADPIAGKGGLVIADGSKVALAGDLLAEAKGGWTTFATVGSFACADGAFPENYRIRTVDNGDGTVDVQARVKPSFAITIQ